MLLHDGPEFYKFNCLTAHFKPGSNTPLHAIPTNCSEKVATNAFYFDLAKFPKNCSVPPMEFYLNPTFQSGQQRTVQELTANYRDMFDRLDKVAAYQSLFSNLWHTSLPCFDIENLTTIDQVAISPTFNEQLFATKVFYAAFMCLQFGFVIFRQKDIAQKLLNKCW